MLPYFFNVATDLYPCKFQCSHGFTSVQTLSKKNPPSEGLNHGKGLHGLETVATIIEVIHEREHH